jgi:CRP/FNR family transcriptional regulator, polysaccharide utilization system transcription regulator
MALGDRILKHSELGLDYSILGKFNPYFSAADQEKLLSSSQILQYAKGEIIMKQGTYANNVMLLHRGFVKIYVESEKNRNVFFRLVPEGEFLCLSDIWGNKNYFFTAKALTDVRICLLNSTVFRELLEKSGALMINLLQSQCETMEYITTRLASIATLQMPGRMADALLYFSNPAFSSYPLLSLISRADLSEFTGMSKENVTRILNEFKGDKLITLEGKKMEIKMPDLLRRLCKLG